jgi:hypothetical protein
MKHRETHITIGSNHSLRSLGRAKARPLTKRYAGKGIANNIRILKNF